MGLPSSENNKEDTTTSPQAEDTTRRTCCALPGDLRVFREEQRVDNRCVDCGNADESTSQCAPHSARPCRGDTSRAEPEVSVAHSQRVSLETTTKQRKDTRRTMDVDTRVTPLGRASSEWGTVKPDRRMQINTRAAQQLWLPQLSSESMILVRRAHEYKNLAPCPTQRLAGHVHTSQKEGTLPGRIRDVARVTRLVQR